MIDACAWLGLPPPTPTKRFESVLIILNQKDCQQRKIGIRTGSGRRILLDVSGFVYERNGDKGKIRDGERHQVYRGRLQIEPYALEDIPVETDIFHIATTIFFVRMATGREMLGRIRTVLMLMYFATFIIQQSCNPFCPAISATIGNQVHPGSTVKDQCRQKNDKQICYSIFHPLQR